MLKRDDLGVFRCADLVNGADGVHVAADLLVGLLCHGDLERRHAGRRGDPGKGALGAVVHTAFRCDAAAFPDVGRTAANGVKHLAILEGLVDIDGADVGDNVAHAAAETGTDGYIAEARLTVAVDEIDNSLHLGRDRLAITRMPGHAFVLSTLAKMSSGFVMFEPPQPSPGSPNQRPGEL